MDVKKFVGFLSKYAVEAVGIAGAFKTILPALPIGRADRDKVESVIERFEGIPASIEAAIKELTKTPAAVIKKSDIEAAVKATLPGVVRTELEKMGDAATMKAAIDEAVKDAVATALAVAAADRPQNET